MQPGEGGPPEAGGPPGTAQEAGPPARVHACTHPGCTLSYARIEHLERHVRGAHSGSTYTCGECNKTFGRSDVLRRHRKIHQRPMDDSKVSKRAARACQACSTSKLKCDGLPTCGRCANNGALCVYDTGSGSGREPKRVRMEMPDRAPSQTGSETSSSLPTLDQRQPSMDLSTEYYPLVDPQQPLTLPPPPGGGIPWNPPTGPTFSHDLDSSMFDVGPPSLVPANSGTMLDSVLNLAFDQHYTTSIEEHLAAAFTLPTDESLFWNQFMASPPNFPPRTDPPPDQPKFPLPYPGPSSTSKSARILITASGLHSRPGSRPPSRQGSPTTEESEEPTTDTPQTTGSSSSKCAPRWPLRYNPGENDTSMTLDPQMVSPAPLAIPAGRPASLPKFDEHIRVALLETLRFAQLSDNEYHSLYAVFARLPLPVFDLLLSLYFYYFHPNFPMFHLPTFSPRTSIAQLLLNQLAIGSVYAPVEGALAMGRVMIEIARRSIERTINRDARLARSLPLAQCQMLWSTCRWIGSARADEITEVFRGVHTTMLRRLEVFEDKEVRPLDPSLTPAQQWKAWVSREERRRTAMTCFLLDGEIATFLHLPPQLATADMMTYLPCSDELWSAPTAEAWLELYKTYNYVKISTATALLSTDSSLPLPQSLGLSPLGARVLIATLQLNLYHARQLNKSGVTSVSDQISAQVRRSLGRLARGDEFAPRFGSYADPRARDDITVFNAAHQAYHLAQISTQIPLQDLDAVAHRPGFHAMDATERWTGWMTANPERSRLIALHAGQLYRIVRDSPSYGTSEPSQLFYAALVLYLYLRSMVRAETSHAHPFALDGRLHEPHEVDTGSWLAFGGPISFQGLSLPLAGEASAFKLLEMVATKLIDSPWRMGLVFASNLRAMVEAMSS